MEKKIATKHGDQSMVYIIFYLMGYIIFYLGSLLGTTFFFGQIYDKPIIKDLDFYENNNSKVNEQWCLNFQILRQKKEKCKKNWASHEKKKNRK